MSLDADVRVTFELFEEQVHLRVADGEVVAVLGPNGSGKSTLLRAIAGIEPIAAGRIVLDGVVLDDPAAKVLVPPERRPCAMVFQDYLLFPHLGAAANVAFGLRCRGTSRADANRQALDWLARMGLADLAPVRPAQLSGGQAQRVAVARALATRPQLLLLDEPVAALDVAARGSVRHELRRQLSEFAGSCVLVTHDPLDAAAIADRLVIIESGRVVQQGTLAEVAGRPRTSYVAELMGVNLLRGRAAGAELLVDPGLRLPLPHHTEGTVLAVFAPRDVALSVAPPPGRPGAGWATRISAIHLMGDRARVVLEAPPGVAAEVTTVTLAELGLTEGTPVWASVEADRIDVYPPGGDPGPPG